MTKTAPQPQLTTDAALIPLALDQHGRDGAITPVDRPIAVEAPVAVEFNGIGYAVVMATPGDLEDFAYGFSLAERLIDGAADVIEVDQHVTDRGVVLRVTLVEARMARIVDRVRHRVSESSCGLCGIENLEQVLRPLPMVSARSGADDPAVFRSLDLLRELQPLSIATGAVHAAALCRSDGTIVMVREDVGRHSAFDKLIGAMLRDGIAWDGGFALLSSRCSYELVEKAVLAGCPMLVTISAQTSLAVERARASGLKLRVLARPDALLAPA
jgi:FdhD protein